MEMCDSGELDFYVIGVLSGSLAVGLVAYGLQERGGRADGSASEDDGEARGELIWKASSVSDTVMGFRAAD